MAYLVRPTKTEYRDVASSRVPKGTPGAKRVTVRASKWYGRGIPGLPPKKRVPLATDKTAARRMLADLVARAEQGQTTLPDRNALRAPLADHLLPRAAALVLVGARVCRRRREGTPGTGTPLGPAAHARHLHPCAGRITRGGGGPAASARRERGGEPVCSAVAG